MKTKWLNILNYNYQEQSPWNGDGYLKTEFVAQHILDIYTYSNMTDNFLCVKTLEVMEAIQENKTFEYISDENNNLWYMAVLHMDFLSDKISWGSSIRGAFWESFHNGLPHNPEGKVAEIGDGMLLAVGTDKQIKYTITGNEEWVGFVDAVLDFCKDERSLEFNK